MCVHVHECMCVGSVHNCMCVFLYVWRPEVYIRTFYCSPISLLKRFSWWIQSSLISARLAARLSWDPTSASGCWGYKHAPPRPVLHNPLLFPQYLQNKIQTEQQGQLCPSQFTTHMLLGFTSHTPRWTEFNSLRHPSLQQLHALDTSGPHCLLFLITATDFLVFIALFTWKFESIIQSFLGTFSYILPYHWTTLFWFSILFILRAQNKA